MHLFFYDGIFTFAGHCGKEQRDGGGAPSLSTFPLGLCPTRFSDEGEITPLHATPGTFCKAVLLCA